MRYLPLTQKDRDEMLAKLGLAKQEELFAELPEKLTKNINFALADGKNELDTENFLSALAAQNISADNCSFFLGGGCYRHHIPAAVDHIIQRAEYLTSYTPYQPEISQGTLTAIFEYQSMICSLTGMDVANASLYDGATSVVEAILMALRIKKKGDIFIANQLNPDYLKVVETYLQDRDSNICQEITDNKIAAIIVQSPDFIGTPHSLEQYRQLADKHNALLIVVVSEIISLGILPAPKLADIVVGEAHSLGVSMNFGGPHLGFFACKRDYLRQIPGRICGYTNDKNGKEGFVLTLNAREQHIRRQKATSNICSNQGLNIVAFSIHLALLGSHGLKKLAGLNHARASLLYNKLKNIEKIKLHNKYFFNEFSFSSNLKAQEVLAKMQQENIMAGIAISEKEILVTITEMNSEAEIHHYANSLAKILK